MTHVNERPRRRAETAKPCWGQGWRAEHPELTAKLFKAFIPMPIL